jgi:hypothetical protein
MESLRSFSLPTFAPLAHSDQTPGLRSVRIGWECVKLRRLNADVSSKALFRSTRKLRRRVSLGKEASP